MNSSKYLVGEKNLGDLMPEIRGQNPETECLPQTSSLRHYLGILSVVLVLFGGIPFPASGAAGDPQLELSSTPTNTVISWPNHAINWVLEESPHLDQPVPWVAVPEAQYQSNGDRFQVTVTTEQENRFFRLAYLGPEVPGLTGRWRLDEGQGFSGKNDVQDQPPLSLTNITWTTGRVGPHAPAFPGNGYAWVSNDDHSLLPGVNAPFTVSFWFNPDALPVGSSSLCGHDGDGFSITLNTSGPGTNQLSVDSTGAGNSIDLSAELLLLPGQWHRLTFTFDGAAASLFLDNHLLDTSAGSLDISAAPLLFGGGLAGHAGFIGRMDGIDILTRSPPGEEIALTGYWNFNENGGAVAGDSSPQAHHARVAPGGWTAGHSGSGLSLSNNTVTIPNPHSTVLPPTGGAFSLSLRVRPELEPDVWSSLLSCAIGSSSGWDLALMRDVSDNTWLRFWSTAAGGTLDLMSEVPVNNDSWHKLDLTFDGGTATVYVDGLPVHSDTGGIIGNTAPLMAGGFAGDIDELRVYGCARSAAEIGPVAKILVKTVLANTTTNIVLEGTVPAGETITFSMSGDPVPTNGNISFTPGSTEVTYTAGATKGPDAFAYTVGGGEFTSRPTLVLISVVEPHWLSPTGGSNPPLDGSTPEKAWAVTNEDVLDDIWQTNNYYDCFFYSPGVFQTRGHKTHERKTANPGCKHIGSGSSGPNQTTLRLVDTRDSWGEGSFWVSRSHIGLSDDFEAHHMLLDCNAENNPKYERGQPEIITIPLTSTSRVNTVTLHWSTLGIPSTGNFFWKFGRASEFTICTRNPNTGLYDTNAVVTNATGTVDTLTIDADTDELVLHLTRRAAGVDFYSLAEVEIDGATVCLPEAKTPTGDTSQLLNWHTYSPILLVDGHTSTTWASSDEEEVELLIPFPEGTEISEVEFYWNCKLIDGIGQLGPADGYVIEARETNSTNYINIPFVRHPRTAAGKEKNIFGTTNAPASVVTDQLRIRLTRRGTDVNFYSLREVYFRNGSTTLKPKLPVTQYYLARGTHYFLIRAFDGSTTTQWTSGTQGMVGAMDVSGSNIQMTDLRIIGYGGKAARECFVMMVRTPRSTQLPTRDFGNVLVENCIFEAPATNNTGGITVLTMVGIPPHTHTNAIVRNCIVKDTSLHFDPSNAYSTTHLENSIAIDCQTGVYFEPERRWIDVVTPVVLRSNKFINVLEGIYVLFHPSSKFDSLTAMNNEIVLTGSRGWGIGACDTCAGGPSGVITNLTALNNVIRYADWQERSTWLDIGLGASEIHNAVFGNNVVTLGGHNTMRVRPCPSGRIPTPTQTEPCQDPVLLPSSPEPEYSACLDILPEGFRRAWFNNRNHHGTLLDVLWSDNNVIRNATQQQWP